MKNIDIWPIYGPKIPIIPYQGIRFLAITQPFLTNRAEILYGNSRDYYLSIGVFGPYLLFSIF